MGSATDGQYLEVCLKRTSSNLSEPPARSVPSSSGSVSKPICTSGMVTLHLGPPTYQVKTYKQVVCKGTQTTIQVTNSAPVSKPPVSTTRSNPTITVKVPATTAVTSNQDSARFQPDNPGISPRSVVISVGTRLTFRSLASVHYKTATILSQPVSVRFVPVDFSWTVTGPESPANTEGRQIVDLSFFTAGEFDVQSDVYFAAEYQLTGAGYWQRAQGLIRTSTTANVKVEPGQRKTVILSPPASIQPPISRGSPRLAATDCRSNPIGAGCSG